MIRAMIHWLEQGNQGQVIDISQAEFLQGNTIAPPREER